MRLMHVYTSFRSRFCAIDIRPANKFVIDFMFCTGRVPKGDIHLLMLNVFFKCFVSFCAAKSYKKYFLSA